VIFFLPPSYFKCEKILDSVPAELNEICKIYKELEKTKIDHENKMYDKSEVTKPITVADWFISFTRWFKYLGYIILYNLCDDQDVAARIASALQAIGALHLFWKCEQVELYSKYLIFLAIPLNLLLCGCESWALKETLV